MKTQHLDEHLARKREQIMKNVLKLKTENGWVDEIPSGWITTEFLGKALGITPRNARNVFRTWTDKGLCETAMFKIRTGLLIKPVPHYKLAPKVAKAYGLPKHK